MNPVFNSFLAIKDANLLSIQKGGIVHGNAKISSITRAPTSRTVGVKRAALLPCAFQKSKKSVSNQPVQCHLFKDDNYVYRVFCTNLAGKAHQVIDEYDKRADVENLVGEAKREGLGAIPSAKFKNNYAFFQIVMLAYNIWRYMKIIAHKSTLGEEADDSSVQGLKGIMANTIRIARLRLLFIAAKVVKDGNVDKVKYSIHDARTPAMIHFLSFLDILRSKVRPWVESSNYFAGSS